MLNLNPNNPQFIRIDFAGHEFLLLASGCCYWPKKKILIVSDLHFEKGSYLAVSGQPLPTADTQDTIHRLQQEINQMQPETVISLGDNVHDGNAFLRMDAKDLNRLQLLCNSVANWHWILGNHDKAYLPHHTQQALRFHSQLLIDSILFTHELCLSQDTQMIGHFHPKISIKKQGIKITGKCFAVANSVMIMPAFGSYTGGLDIDDAAYQNILPPGTRYYLLSKGSIFLAK